MRNQLAILLLLISCSTTRAGSESQPPSLVGTTEQGTYTNAFFKLTWHFPETWRIAPVAPAAAGKTGFHQLLRLLPGKDEELSFAVQDLPRNSYAWEKFPEVMTKTVTNDGWDLFGGSDAFYIGNLWLKRQEFVRKDKNQYMSTVVGPLRGYELEFFASAATHEELDQLMRMISGIQIVPDWENQLSRSIKTNDPEPTPELLLEGKDSVKKLHISRNVRPEYPPIAAAARVQGNVVLECRITTDGKIASIYLLQGNPCLIQSAIAAVSQWEYERFKRDGVPVPVQTEISVVFSLHP